MTLKSTISFTIAAFIFSANVIYAQNISPENSDILKRIMSVRDEMKAKMAEAEDFSEIENIDLIYNAKANKLLSRPIQIFIEWDEMITRQFFEVRSIMIDRIISDNYDFFMYLNITIIAKADRIKCDLAGYDAVAEIDGKEYQLNTLKFLDEKGTIMMTGFVTRLEPTKPLTKGDLGRLVLFFCPITAIYLSKKVVY